MSAVFDEPYWNLLNASVRPGSEGSRRFDPGGVNLGSVPKNGQIHTEFWGVISGPADIGVGVADTGSIAVRRYCLSCVGCARQSLTN